MKIYITSDLHFFHKSILNFCPATRPYADITEMNAAIIKQWNDIVNPDDLTYILGDISFSSPNNSISVISQLNGRKILVFGNHDSGLLKNQTFRNCFESIHQLLDVRYNNHKIVMCHYPIFDHKNCERGALMLHGHRHGNPTNIPGRIKDVGYDATGKVVSLLDDIIEELVLIEPMMHY